MPVVKKEHFLRSAADIGKHGDNDTLPFDIDTRFIECKKEALADIAYNFCEQLERDSATNNTNRIKFLSSVFSERLVVPAGPAGFRVTTKIHPFWNLYFNGLGVAIAEALEPKRFSSVYSYRFLPKGEEELFNRGYSWRAFKETTASGASGLGENAIVVQTDISSFYEHISHHHIKNFIDDLFYPDNKIGNQVEAFLNKFSGGRSFGLPVGGQCARILAELFLHYVDEPMTSKGIHWYRYVDDYVLIANSHEEAYQALSFLSHTLSNFGLTLNRTKTIVLTAKHYKDYVLTQLGNDDEDTGKLRSIDLSFDPYSDSPIRDYESLKQTVESLQVQKLLNRELEKALPDSFLVSQIGRTLAYQSPKIAIELVDVLLSPHNLHACRGSWSTIMRGINYLRNSPDYNSIAGMVDILLDSVPNQSSHLLMIEANLLHYLRTIRFSKTTARAAFVQHIYDTETSKTIQRACIECWRQWRDRSAFTHLRTNWDNLSSECQRLAWLASFSFGDQGDGFRRQIRAGINQSWRLGIEKNDQPSYSSVYEEWCNEDDNDL